MEIIDVFDSDNNSLGYSVTRDEIHERKLWHRHVSAWIMNDKGMILLQKRSLAKKKYPGHWAKTGGHVEVGEDVVDAIKREVYEEIGLKVENYEFVNLLKKDKGHEKYFAYSYIIYTNLKEDEFILQKDEVDCVKYYSIEELIDNRNNKLFTFSKWDDESFNNEMNMLKEYRKKLGD